MYTCLLVLKKELRWSRHQSILLTWDISFNEQNFDSKMYCKKEDYKNLNENSEFFDLLCEFFLELEHVYVESDSTETCPISF